MGNKIKIQVDKEYLETFCKHCPERLGGTCEQDDNSLLICNLILAIQEGNFEFEYDLGFWKVIKEQNNGSHTRNKRVVGRVKSKEFCK